jgi:hypothetical protein
MRKEDVLDDSKTFKPEAIKALRRFKALKTFRPETPEGARLEGMQTLTNDLVDVYGLRVVIPVMHNPGWGMDMAQTTDENVPVIPISLFGPNLSIITLLHQFAGIRKYIESDGEDNLSFLGRQRYAANLFRKVYPRQFARLVFDEMTGCFLKNIPMPLPNFAVELEGTQLPAEMQAFAQQDEQGDEGADADFEDPNEL